MKTVAIVLAAGSGSRMNSDVKKQYMEIGGKPLIYYSLKAFEESIIDDIVLVVSRGDVDFVKKEIVEKYGFDKVTAVVDKQGKGRKIMIFKYKPKKGSTRRRQGHRQPYTK